MADISPPRPLSVSDAEGLVLLVNSAYRGDSGRQGWTTESDLLDGVRLTLQDAESLLAENLKKDPQKVVLGVYQESTPSLSRALISGCVCLERSSDQAAYLGMLTVNPAAQRAGLGKQLIQAAESWIKARWASTCAIEMTVISVRSELIAFYERRGFSQTGERRPFPGYQDPERFGTPKRPDLEFVVLRKTLD